MDVFSASRSANFCLDQNRLGNEPVVAADCFRRLCAREPQANCDNSLVVRSCGSIGCGKQHSANRKRSLSPCHLWLHFGNYAGSGHFRRFHELITRARVANSACCFPAAGRVFFILPDERSSRPIPPALAARRTPVIPARLVPPARSFHEHASYRRRSRGGCR
jgi:hypothetical protein